jgi:hypothetical protein
MDFIVYNVVGYMFYATYSTLGFFFLDPGAGTVVLADIIFIYHGLLMVFVWAIQAIIYPWGKNRISGYCIIISLIMEVLIILFIILTEVSSQLYIVFSCST